MKRFHLLLLASALLLFSSCAGTYRAYEVDLNPEAGLAERHLSEGSYDRALESYARAKTLYEAQNNEQGVLFCLERMGWIQRESGLYGEALQSFRAAHPLGVRLNGDAAEIDADLGDVYLFSGAPEKALEHYQRTLTTLKDFVFRTSYATPPSSREISAMVRKSKAIIHARTNLGTLHYFAREYDKAIESLQAAHQLIQRIRSVADHPLYGLFINLDSDTGFLEGAGFCKTLTGAVYGETNRFEEAWSSFDAGREYFQKGERLYGLLVNQALRYKIEFLSPGYEVDDRRLQEYDRFLDRAEGFGAQDIVWRMAFEIGQFMARERRSPEAGVYLARAVEALEKTRSRLREDTVKKMFSSSVQDVYTEMIRVLFEMKRFEEGFDYLERARARAFLDMLAGRSVAAKKSVDPALLRREKEVQEEIERVSRGLRTSKGSARAALSESYRALLKERADILERIKTQSLEFAATTTVTTVPVKKISERVGKGAALVAYFLDAEKSTAWVVSRGTVQVYGLNAGAREIADLVADYRHAVATHQDQASAEAGRKLSSLLILPFLESLSGLKGVYVVPSGPLHHLPFAGLPLPDGRFLMETHTLSVLPSGSSLFFMDKQITAERDSLLALGNPEREGPEPPLPFAEEEVRVISRDFPKKTVRTGREATESLVKSDVWAGTGIIHVAAHGKYNSAEPLKSSLLLSPDGVNDGNLEMFEIFSLRVNPRLVVLSACESGIGKLEGGEEVQGLNRAFLYAGAGGVLSSLWSVSDHSTYRLMEHFYGLLGSMPAAEALRLAQIRLKKEFPSPFHWAPFYLTGGMDL